tara:strand:+ start:1954 stop:2820 length:867 start_codon:yes stop_codon:yes gene_type:complete
MIDPAEGTYEPVTVINPKVRAVPVFFDSPHSGSMYPDDFRAAANHLTLRRMEDAFVDELFEAAPNCGAILIAARFPRGYIDPNRSDDDIDPNALSDWRGKANPTSKSEKGKGLIWTHVHGLQSLYNRKITDFEINHRIETYWRPYHAAVHNAYETLYAQFGCVFHLNCHSMRSMGNQHGVNGVVSRPDFVISDHDGTSSESAFLDTVITYLRETGANVDVNQPFKGAELTKRYSDPSCNKHALQIEINRGLYMNETTVEKSTNFENMRTTMSGLAQTICNFAAEPSTE